MYSDAKVRNAPIAAAQAIVTSDDDSAQIVSTRTMTYIVNR